MTSLMIFCYQEAKMYGIIYLQVYWKTVNEYLPVLGIEMKFYLQDLTDEAQMIGR